MKLRFPLAWFGRAPQTLCEWRKAAWGGEPIRFKRTYEGRSRKQWRPIQITKRRAS